jgi:hypothetical protein
MKLGDIGAIRQGWEIVLADFEGNPVGLSMTLGHVGLSVFKTDGGEWVLRAFGVEVPWASGAKFDTLENVLLSANVTLVRMFRDLADKIVQRGK